jgi:hypothetical protein
VRSSFRTETRHDRRVARALFALALTVYAFFGQGCIRNTDGATMAQVTAAMVDHRDLAVAPTLPGGDGLDGRHYSQYGLGTSLATVPLYLAGKAFYAAGGGRIPLDVATGFALSWLNPLIGALLVAAVFGLARQIGVSLSGAVVAALVCGFATNLTPHVKDLFSEPLTALCLAMAFREAWRAKERGPAAAAFCGLWWGAAFLTRAASMAAFPALMLLVVMRLPRPQRLAGAAGMAAACLPGIAIFAAYNVVRFGIWTETGYWSKPFLTPLLRGLSVDLASPERGILWYSPALLLVPLGVLALRDGARAFTVAVAAFFVPHLLLYATFEDVFGGQSWGGRFMVPLLPLLCVFVGAAWQNLSVRARPWAVALLVLSAIVQFPAMYIHPGRYFTDLRIADAAGEVQTWPQRVRWSPLVHGWAYVPAATAALWHPDELRGLTARPVTRDDRELAANSLYFRLPYIWWVMAAFSGAPPALCIGTGGLLLGAGAAAVLWLRRTLRVAGEPEVTLSL